MSQRSLVSGRRGGGAKLLAGVLLLSASGCDGALSSGATLDQPYLLIEGPIEEESRGLGANLALGVGLLWIDPLQEGDATFVAGPELAVTKIAGRHYEMALRRLPPPGAVRVVDTKGAPSSSSFSFGLAEIVLFEDRDGDGRFQVGALADGAPMQAPDVYRGMPQQELVIFVGTPLPPAREPWRELGELANQPGYHLVSADCGVEIFEEVASNSIPLHLGPESTTFPDLRPCLRTLPGNR